MYLDLVLLYKYRFFMRDSQRRQFKDPRLILYDVHYWSQSNRLHL